MDNNKISFNDEIDLMDIFEILWKSKWKIFIITLVSTFLGFTFSFYQQNSFVVSTSIQSGKSSVFIEFKPINDVLKENELLFTENNINGYLIHAQTIFQTFVEEFNDYEEMRSVLRNNTFVSQSIENLDEFNKEKQLIKYAKLFVLTSPSFGESKNKQQNDSNININSPLYSTLSFKWHDITEGSFLFEQALLQTLKNIKITLIKDIDKLASTIDMKNQRELQNLSTELNLVKHKQKLDNERRIQFLLEQSSIAKELGIEMNRLDANALIQSQGSLSLQSEKNNILVNTNSYEFPYYLRGYKAIDKEIDIIKNRSKEEQLLAVTDFHKISNKILLLEKDLSSFHLRSFLKDIEKLDPNKWVEFNLALADSKSQKNTTLYIFLPMLFGFIISIIYVFFSNALLKRNEQIKNA